MARKSPPDKIKFNGAVYRLADAPVFESPPPADPPGPTLSLKDFEDLKKLTKEEFKQASEQLAKKMVSRCDKHGVERWCVAVNGVLMGSYESEKLALEVSQHWLFLKMLTPQRKVKMGKRSVVASEDSVLDYLIPQNSLYDVIETLDESGDDQLSTMLGDVMSELSKRLKVDQDTKEALRRVMEVVKRHKELASSPGLIRNNLGKAMAALKLKTPLFF